MRRYPPPGAVSARLTEFLARLVNPQRHYFRKVRAELAAAEGRLEQRLGAIENKVQQDALLLSRADLCDALPLPGRIAVVTPLPPARTGVAPATLNSFAPWPGGADFFGCPSSAADLSLLQHHRALAGGRHRVFHLDFLAEAVARFSYEALVFSFGNSIHNAPIVSWLLRSREFSDRPPVIAYVHDPIVFDVLRSATELMGHESDELFRRAYDREALVAFRRRATGTLLGRGVSGLRALRREARVDLTLVNSLAARRFLIADDPTLEDHEVGVFFHPVFGELTGVQALPRAAFAEAGTVLRIGCFGILSANKQPDAVLAAVRLLRERGLDARLILAGYDINDFAVEHALEGLDYVELYQNPGDSQLVELMSTAHVAVQLRDRNTGETSGVVSQLMGLGVPTLVSRIGAFEEFADAVGFVAPGAEPQAIAEAILAIRADAAGYRNRSTLFASQRTPQRFCAELERAIGRLRVARTGPGARADQIQAVVSA
jgi:glycosyltransferase involved in cell wall biosynthesis